MMEEIKKGDLVRVDHERLMGEVFGVTRDCIVVQFENGDIVECAFEQVHVRRGYEVSV